MKKRILSLVLMLTMLTSMCAFFPLVVGAKTYSASDTITWNNHVYTVYNVNVSWVEAYLHCKKIGGHLATITSAAENSVVHGLISGNYYYLGGTDSSKEGSWRWINGDKWTYSNWNSGEPNNGNGGKPQSYVAMNADGTWDDAWSPDDYVSGFVCEWDSIVEKESACDTGVSTNANNLYQKMNDYLDTLESELEKDVSENETLDYLADYLMELDFNSKNPIITLHPDLSEKEKCALYKAYAKYLKEWHDKEFELGKINLKDSKTVIATKLTNDIASALNYINEIMIVDGYSIKIEKFTAGKSGFGTIKIHTKDGKIYDSVICSNQEECVDTFADFIEQLRDITYDVLKQANTSVLTELADVTGFADFEKSKIKSALKKATDALDAEGMGDVYKTAEKCREVYDLIEDILSLKKTETFEESVKKAEKLMTKLEAIDFSDSTVKNKALEHAIKEITKYKNELLNSLQDYIYNIESNECPKEEKGFFKNIKNFFRIEIQCPVDFELIDETGNNLGYVKDNIAYGQENIFVEKRGDRKTICIPSELQCNINMLATNNGFMNYVVTKYIDGKQVDRLNYYDVEIIKGDSLCQSLSELSFEEKENVPLIINQEVEFSANERLDCTDDNNIIYIISECSEGGMILNNKGNEYIKGDPVELTAFPKDGYKFNGWYIDDELVSNDATYRFTALKDVVVGCNFIQDGTVPFADTPAFTWSGNRYQVVDVELTPPDAEQLCIKYGGHLVTITSADEQDFVNSIAESANVDTYIIGATDRSVEGEWTWMTGEPWDYSNWSTSSEPNDGLGRGEDYCVSSTSRGRKWLDVYGGYDNYTSRDAFICEWDNVPSNNNESHTTSFGSEVSNWAKEEVEEAYDEKLVPEVLVGKDLTQKVDRAEFAAIAVALYENLTGSKATKSNNPFNDIYGNGCEDDILKAYNLDITTGTSATTFDPNVNITREQMATMLTRAYKKSEFKDWTIAKDADYPLNFMGVQKFADDSEISDYAKESVYFMARWDIIKGVGGNKFAPKNSATLGESYGYATREQAVIVALRSAKHL